MPPKTEMVQLNMGIVLAIRSDLVDLAIEYQDRGLDILDIIGGLEAGIDHIKQDFAQATGIAIDKVLVITDEKK